MRRCDVEGMFSSPLYFAIVRREMFSPSFVNIQWSVSSDSGCFLSSSEMKFCSVTRGNALRLSLAREFPVLAAYRRLGDHIPRVVSVAESLRRNDGRPGCRRRSRRKCEYRLLPDEEREVILLFPFPCKKRRSRYCAVSFIIAFQLYILHCRSRRTCVFYHYSRYRGIGC